MNKISTAMKIFLATVLQFVVVFALIQFGLIPEISLHVSAILLLIGSFVLVKEDWTSNE